MPASHLDLYFWLFENELVLVDECLLRVFDGTNAVDLEVAHVHHLGPVLLRRYCEADRLLWNTAHKATYTLYIQRTGPVSALC